MRRLRSTMTLIMEYEPNINMPQNLVKALTPVRSKASSSISPKEAQKSDWEVSNRLSREEIRRVLTAYIHTAKPYTKRMLGDLHMPPDRGVARGP